MSWLSTNLQNNFLLFMYCINQDVNDLSYYFESTLKLEKIAILSVFAVNLNNKLMG